MRWDVKIDRKSGAVALTLARLVWRSPAEYGDLVAFRRRLHAHPELSGQEVRTAAVLHAELVSLGADRVLTGLGGHGVAAIFESASWRVNPQLAAASSTAHTVIIRADMDALPIQEHLGKEEDIRPHMSTIPGCAHLCGHDGHMTIALSVCRVLSTRPPQSGRVVVLFQPAEETGQGAR